MLIAAMAMGACSVQGDIGPALDAGSQDAPVPTCDGKPLDVPAGCACSGTFCDDYAGWCASGVCRAFCSATNYPRCPAGQAEMHQQYMGADQCVCVPG